MRITVMSAIRNDWRNEETTMRFMRERLRGVEPSAGEGALIDSA
jgi:hypothetical protein